MKVRNEESSKIIGEMFRRQSEAVSSGKVYSNTEVGECVAKAILDTNKLFGEERSTEFLKVGQGFQFFTTELEEPGTVFGLPQAIAKGQDSVKVWICKNLDFCHEHILDFVLDLDVVHFQMDFAENGGINAYVAFRWGRINSGFVLHFVEEGEKDRA